MRRELFFIEDKVGAWKYYEEKEMRTEEEYLDILAEKGETEHAHSNASWHATNNTGQNNTRKLN